MTRIDQLAAVAARVAALRVAPVPAGAHSPGPGEVAYVVTDQDGVDLAAAYNALPDLLACVHVLARIEARRAAGKHTTLVADRKAMAFAWAKLNA